MPLCAHLPAARPLILSAIACRPVHHRLRLRLPRARRGLLRRAAPAAPRGAAPPLRRRWAALPLSRDRRRGGGRRLDGAGASHAHPAAPLVLLDRRERDVAARLGDGGQAARVRAQLNLARRDPRDGAVLLVDWLERLGGDGSRRRGELAAGDADRVARAEWVRLGRLDAAAAGAGGADGGDGHLCAELRLLASTDAAAHQAGPIVPVVVEEGRERLAREREERLVLQVAEAALAKDARALGAAERGGEGTPPRGDALGADVARAVPLLRLARRAGRHGRVGPLVG
mmetsp:Transcript_21084/g.67952  ORF Transcript_21084/g.67952 Transcript_21084/m.67952 type:complete len:286 (-) Transcript_21084:537-1394(-)